MMGHDPRTSEEDLRAARRYIREKVDQLLGVMGTLPLRPEELDDRTLLELDPIGIIARAFAQILDNQRETNQRLTEARDETRALVDAAGAAIAVIDETLRVLEVNRFAGDTLFSGRGRVIGSPLGEVLGDSGLAARLSPLFAGETIRTEIQVGDRVFQMTSSVLGGGEPGRRKAICIFFDITGHHRMAHDLRGMNAELERRVRERTVELERAISEAEAASAAKSRFLANMSHELRTPLNAVIGFSDVMRHQIFGPLGDERYLGYARDIHGSGQHLLELVSEILDMSKIEAGRYSIYKEDVILSPVLDEAVSLIQHRVAEGGLTLRLAVPPDLPALRADRRALKQVLLNMLSNAAKFTPEEGLIEVRAGVRDGWLAVAVRDTGIGIPADQLERVMQPFAQVDGEMTRRQEGTGLGLPLSKALMELHGGSLTLESTLGEGTTVTMALPLDEAPAAPATGR